MIQNFMKILWHVLSARIAHDYDIQERKNAYMYFFVFTGMGRLGFSVDRGGTFTDVCVFREDGSCRVLKLLSQDPSNYEDAPTEAIRRVLQEENGYKLPKGFLIPIGEWIALKLSLLFRKSSETFLICRRYSLDSHGDNGSHQCSTWEERRAHRAAYYKRLPGLVVHWKSDSPEHLSIKYSNSWGECCLKSYERHVFW